MAIDEKRIVDVAWTILSEGGPSAITMSEVAKRLSVTTPALYKHVANRDALLDTVARRGWAQFGQALAEGSDEPSDRLGGIGGRYLRFGMDHPQVYRLLFMDQPTTPIPDGPSRPGPGFQVLLDQVVAAQAAGAIHEGRDPYTVGILLWSTVHGLVSLYVGGGASRLLSRADYLALARRVLAEQLAML